MIKTRLPATMVDVYEERNNSRIRDSECEIDVIILHPKELENIMNKFRYGMTKPHFRGKEFSYDAKGLIEHELRISKERRALARKQKQLEVTEGKDK